MCLLAGLHRAGPGDGHDSQSADPHGDGAAEGGSGARFSAGGPADGYDRVILAELPGGQLVRRGDGDDARHAGEELDLADIDACDADRPEDSFFLSDDFLDGVPAGDEELADMRLLVVTNGALEDDDHDRAPVRLSSTGAY